MRESFLPFSRPDFDGNELALIGQVLDSGWITTGEVTHRFEREFSEEIGAKHSIAVNSCTAALHLAMECIGIGPGDEVVTTPYTFASTAEVVRYLGATPRFADIDPETLNIDPAAVLAAVGPKTKAIVPVHVGGHPADLAPLDEIAAEHGLAMIEDAAHSLPAAYRGVSIGAARPRLRGLPHLVCFSFYATKTMTTGEGGMVCTDDEDIAARCRLMSLHGISKDAWKRYAADGSWYYEITAPGFKYNLTDMAAALGLSQLGRLRSMRDRRAQIVRQYTDAFSGIDALELPRSRAEIEHAWHLYVIRLQRRALTIDRNTFIEELRKRNIGTSVHFIPLHIHPYYRETYSLRPDDFPVAYREYERAVSLPVYSAMSDDDACDVIDAVKEIVDVFRR